MGQDVKNKDPLCFIVDASNQAVVIAVDVEDGPATDKIGMGEVLSHVNQRPPGRLACNPVPVHQRRQCVGTPLGEPGEGRPADHSHDPSVPEGEWKRRGPGSILWTKESES